MIKKVSLAIVAIAIVTIALLLYFFFTSGPEPIEPAPSEDVPCLVFQSIDMQSPCYVRPIPTATSTSNGVRPSDPIETACASASNPFERNDCVTNLAVERRDSAICGSVEGSLAKDMCVAETKAAASPAASSSPSPVVSSPQKQAFAAALEQMFKESTSKASISANIPRNTPSYFSSVTTSGASANDLEQKFRTSISSGASLVVYSASRYQVAPGDTIKIYGAGFTASNTVNMGSFQVSASSADGSTIPVQAPGTIGDYEIWVTNEKGSSRNAQRPVRITVTSSPKPVPTIASASPSVVPLGGTVTLTGSGFSAKNNVFTSMGTVMDVASANGTSLSFKVSDLEYVNKVKDMPQFKGRTVSVLVNLQADGGTTESMFKFDVQF